MLRSNLFRSILVLFRQTQKGYRMEQDWIYCSTICMFPYIARWKRNRLKKYLRKQNKKKQVSIYEWKTNRSYQTGLYLLYRKAREGKVKQLYIYSLKDIHRNKQKQMEFIKDMQELEIPVFCFQTKQYVTKEKN